MAERRIIEISKLRNGSLIAKVRPGGRKEVAIFTTSDNLARQVELRMENSMVVFDDNVDRETEEIFCDSMLSFRDQLANSGVKFSKAQK